MPLNGRTPTREEQRWMDDVTRYVGCIVCQLDLWTFTPCEIHHIDGKTNPGAHLLTIGLCYRHHRGGEDNDEYTSRDPHKTRFEERYRGVSTHRNPQAG